MNTQKGKFTNVLIEDHPLGLTVWADSGFKEDFESIPGVIEVKGRSSVEYIIYFDRRYEIEWIKQEITAKIKIEQ